jgi:predicted PurR-regulated permease PerM
MNDSRTGSLRLREVVRRGDSVDPPEDNGRRSILATGLTLLAACVCLFLLWQTVSSLLLIFSGVLFTAFLDAAARALAPVLPLDRVWRLTLVPLLLAGVTGFGLDWGAGKLPDQTRLLIKVMDTQLDVVQAGLSNFIPYLGPIVATIPIALVAMPLGASLLIWAVVIYTIIQSIEGYVIGPLIQRQAVEIPPAWTLVAIVLLGALFGVMGIALAMPLVAIGRVAIIRFYVEGYLGDDLKQTIAHIRE